MKIYSYALPLLQVLLPLIFHGANARKGLASKSRSKSSKTSTNIFSKKTRSYHRSRYKSSKSNARYAIVYDYAPHSQPAPSPTAPPPTAPPSLKNAPRRSSGLGRDAPRQRPTASTQKKASRPRPSAPHNLKVAPGGRPTAPPSPLKNEQRPFAGVMKGPTPAPSTLTPTTAGPTVTPGNPTAAPTPAPTPEPVQPCTSNTACANGACGLELFDTSSNMICCPSGTTERIPNRQRDGIIYCTQQAVGATCGTNTLCESGVCVGGICLAQKQGSGQTCDANDNEDCANGACGLELFNTASSAICCPSGATERIPNSQQGGIIYCTGQATGAACGTNTQCTSGVCVGETCLAQKQGIGQTCDTNDNDDCANAACALELFDTSSNMICCPSWETERIPNRQRDGVYYCTEQATGFACGSNTQCTSGVCDEAGGTCQ